jgi:5-methylphenazine-1-carboxylate 1-monooxygenase
LHLASTGSVETALAVYDAKRQPSTSEIVLSNREGGPEGVIDMVEARAPDGFEHIDSVATHDEREAIVRGYARLAGFARQQAVSRSTRKPHPHARR